MSIASDKLVKECEEKMLKTIETVKEKFTAIRAGRANVSMLDGVKVDNYGSEVPLNQVGTVSAPEARVVYTSADWYDLRGEKEDRKGNVKFDLNVGLDNTRVGVTANVGYDTKVENLRGGLGLRVIF